VLRTACRAAQSSQSTTTTTALRVTTHNAALAQNPRGVRHLGFWSEFREKMKEGVDKNPELEQSLKDLDAAREKAAAAAAAARDSEQVQQMQEAATVAGEKLSEGATAMGEKMSEFGDAAGKAADYVGSSQVAGAVGGAASGAASGARAASKAAAAAKKATGEAASRMATAGLESKAAQVTGLARLVSIVKTEAMNLRDHIYRNKLPELASKRQMREQALKEQAEAVDAEEAATEAAENLANAASPKDAAMNAAVDAVKAAAAKSAAAAEAQTDTAAGPMPDTGPIDAETTAMVFVDADAEKETVWSKRIEDIKSKLKQTAMWKQAREATHTLSTTDNPVIKTVRDAKYTVEDTIEDARDAYETSQHPLVWQMRDVGDRVFGETETGWALGEMLELDQRFNQERFLDDMEVDMIPIVTKAFLRGDKDILEAVCEGQAARAVFASMKEREVKKETYDERILDISHVDMSQATVVEDTPMLLLSFMCQHVHCIRNAKGEITEGSESDIRSVYYQWMVRRDFESEIFDYKLVELQLQRVHALV
jgi:hypothetical protein